MYFKIDHHRRKKGSSAIQSEVKTERESLTLARESVAVVIRVACTRTTSRLIGTRSVHVTASIVLSALVHIYKQHKVLRIYFGTAGYTD